MLGNGGAYIAGSHFNKAERVRVACEGRAAAFRWPKAETVCSDWVGSLGGERMQGDEREWARQRAIGNAMDARLLGTRAAEPLRECRSYCRGPIQGKEPHEQFSAPTPQ